MNKVKEALQLVGLKVGEHFTIERQSAIYKIDDNGVLLFHMEDTDEWSVSGMFSLLHLINGSVKIIKLSFRPKCGNVYYSFNVYGEIVKDMWLDTMFDYLRLQNNMVFESKDDITQEFIEETLKKLKGDN